MACYYYLRLPTGGELRIPASFGNLSLSNTLELRGLIDNYKNNKDEKGSALVSYIKNNTPLNHQKIAHMIKDLAINNSDITDEELNKFIISVNKEIEELGDNYGLSRMIQKAVFKNTPIEIFKDNVWATIPLEEVIKALSMPIYRNYFDRIDADTILGGYTYENIKNELVIKESELDSIGMDPTIYKHFRDLFKYLFPRIGNTRSVKSFFKTSFKATSLIGVDDSVIVFDPNATNPIIFYNADSELSLPIANFKILGIKTLIGKEKELKAIIEDFNKVAGDANKIKPETTIVEFFIGGTNSEGFDFDPELYKMLQFGYGQKALEKIIDLIVTEVEESKRSEIGKALKAIVSFMDPANLSKFNKQIKSHKTNSITQSEQILATEKTQIQRVVELFSDGNRNKHYNIPKSTEVLNSAREITNILDSLAKHRDIIKVTAQNDNGNGTIDRYIVPTRWTIVDGGVLVRGWYSHKGNLTPYRGIIKTGKPLTYSTLESFEKPEIYVTDVISKFTNPLIVLNDLENPLPPEVLLSVIKRGSVVKYLDSNGNERTGTVKNVFPGGIQLNSLTTGKAVYEFSIKLNKIFEIQTDRKLLEVLVPENLKTGEEVNNYLKGIALEVIMKLQKTGKNTPIGRNDWVTTRIDGKEMNNLALGANDKYVYILVQSDKGSKVINVERSKVVNVYKEPVSFTKEEFTRVDEFYKAVVQRSSIKNHAFSTFTNKEFLKNGDYIWSPSKQLLYKVTNIEINEIVKYKAPSGVEYVPEFPKDGIFITERFAASNDYALSIDFNNFYIQSVTEVKPNQEERLYYIPKDATISIENLLASGNLNIGFSQPVGMPIDLSIYKDVTADVVKLINTHRSTKGKKLVGTKHDGYIKRYDANLMEFKYGENNKDLLRPGMYVTLKDKQGKSYNHKYKIVNIENGVYLLEYSTFNKMGDVVSTSELFDPSNSEFEIERVYIMMGNTNIPNFKKAEVKTEKEVSVSKKEVMANIIESFKELYDIEVEVTTEIDPKYKDKKAFINANKKSTITINGNYPDAKQELVHEYLHLFLMAAKYNNPGFYESLMAEYLDKEQKRFAGRPLAELTSEEKVHASRIMELSLDKMDFNAVEEIFVEQITEHMWKNPSELAKIDTDKFLGLFDKIMKDLGMVEENDSIFGDDLAGFHGIFTILNYEMSKIPAFGDLGKKSKENASLVYYDANFRAWIDDMLNGEDGNLLIINCK